MHFKDLTNSPKAKTFKNDTRGSFIKNKNTRGSQTHKISLRARLDWGEREGE